VIEGATVTERTDVIFKLVALTPTNVEAVLIARGLDPQSLNVALEAVAGVDIPFDLQGAIEYSFQPKPQPPLFGLGRFGDGTYPVFYSALEDATCIEEVRHHRREALARLLSEELPFPRHFALVRCDFEGQTIVLVGHEESYTDLTSVIEAGYPFCRAVARWAQTEGAQALHSTSARRHEGTCVPVFARACVSNPTDLRRYRFVVRHGNVECEQV
jgi:RES domain